MSDKKTTTIAIDQELWKLAKSHNIKIGKCAETGIRIELGIVKGEEKLKEELEKSQQKTEYIQNLIKELHSVKATEEDAIISQEALREKAIDECYSSVADNKTLGRNKITEIAMKYGIQPEILIHEMEKQEDIEICNFHIELKDTKSSVIM